MLKYKHPASYNQQLLNALDKLVPDTGVILDFFGGVGKVGALARAGRIIIAGEIEKKWANQSVDNGCDFVVIADATRSPFKSNSIDAVVVSPSYGNRLADVDKSQRRRKKRKSDYTRRTYRSYYGKDLHINNSGNNMQWVRGPRGKAYRLLHFRAWLEAARLLKVGGLLIINCKDHIRNGKWMHVCDWHWSMVERIGFEQRIRLEIPTTGDQNQNRHKQQGKRVVAYEQIAVYKKVSNLIPHERYLIHHAEAEVLDYI